jgi:hypothetical protein
MRVRTNISALVSGAIISAVLSVVMVGAGEAPHAVTDPGLKVTQMQRDDRLPTFHRVGAEGVAPSPSQAVAPAPAPSTPPTPASPPRPKFDAYVVQGLLGALIYISLFTLGHLGLRRANVAGRWPYAGIGGACALVAVAVQTHPQAWQNLVTKGIVSEYLLVPAVAGAILGFIYHWRSGLEAESDDPAVLEAIVKSAAPTGSEVADSAAAAKVSGDGSLIDTGDLEYFAGPLRVRTSLPLMFVAALLSAGAFGLVQALFGTGNEFLWRISGAPHPNLNEAFGASLSYGLGMAALVTLGTALPFTFVVFVGHMAVRALNRTSYAAYVAVGLSAPILVGLFLGVMGVLVGLMAILPLMIAMGTYRSMAGLEPKPVKEDIMVKDRRDLVGADHARRQYGRLIKS